MSRIRSVHPGLWTEECRAAGPGTHLYLLQEGDAGPCKVGISRNALWRRADLQSGNPRTLHLRALFIAPDRRDAILAEASTLEHFAVAHLTGEWLDVGPETLAAFIQEGFCNGAN